MMFIVTTTINEPTEATLKFCELAQKHDYVFIIVGDKKTPHMSYEELSYHYPQVVYLHPDHQHETYPALSEATGWNCIQRRNIGFVYAYRMGADVIATVDDDNIPYDHWGPNFVNEEITVNMYEPESGVFDPLSVTNYPNLWHRGYPIELLRTRNRVEFKGVVKRKVLIQADFWDGDPDIDAMCRLTQKPVCKFDHKFEFCSNRISPFNSQNTFISRSVIPYYSCWPGVGRMDDIWGGYYVQSLFPNSLIYGTPTVYQDRNPQDLIKNLENEVIGYRNTFNWLMGQYVLPSNVQDYIQLYCEQFA